MSKKIMGVICIMTAAALSACSVETGMAADRTDTEDLRTLEVSIGDRIYTLRLEENDSAKALAACMPMELVMSDLNQNEKFIYLEDSLPADSQKIGTIRAGDFMLYGSDCLVLFYEDFQSPYSYTRLGYLEHDGELGEAVGDGSVTVRFRLGE